MFLCNRFIIYSFISLTLSHNKNVLGVYFKSKLWNIIEISNLVGLVNVKRIIPVISKKCRLLQFKWDGDMWGTYSSVEVKWSVPQSDVIIKRHMLLICVAHVKHES